MFLSQHKNFFLPLASFWLSLVEQIEFATLLAGPRLKKKYFSWLCGQPSRRCWSEDGSFDSLSGRKKQWVGSFSTAKTQDKLSRRHFSKCAVKHKVGKIYSPTPFESATKALKLEEDFSSGGCMSAMSMYPSDKMKMTAPGCFTGRYSPTSYRNPDQMRRCMTNPSVSDKLEQISSHCLCINSTAPRK